MRYYIHMEWPGVTPEQYEKLIELVDWKNNPPAGTHAHIVAFSDNALFGCAVWESLEAFQAFAEQRMFPAVMQLGIHTEPRREILPLYSYYAVAEAEKDAVVLS